MQQLLAEPPGDLAPRRSGRGFRQHRHMPVLTVQTPSREQALFQRVGKLQPAVGPDVGDGSGGKQEQCPTISRQSNPRSDQFL